MIFTLAIISAYSLSFMKKTDDDDDDKTKRGKKESRFNIARMFNIGKLFNYSDSKIWHSAPKLLQILFDDYLYFNGKKKKEVKSIADNAIAF